MGLFPNAYFYNLEISTAQLWKKTAKNDYFFFLSKLKKVSCLCFRKARHWQKNSKPSHWFRTLECYIKFEIVSMFQ